MLVYNVTAAAFGASNVDTLAAVDPEFSQRNNHYIFSENYKLLAWQALGVSLTDCRFNIPSWNAIVRAHCWPLDRAATPTSFRRLLDQRDDPPDLPVNEEIAVELSNNKACGTETETSAIWIAPPSWNRNIPQDMDNPATKLPGGGKLRRFTLRATCSVTRIANAWSLLTPLTFAENLRGGWYCVHSAWVFSANARYFRLVFPRMPLYKGRRLRPGSVVSHAVADIEEPIGSNFFGTWGYFHSFEPPQIEEFADAAGADSIEVRLDCSFYGYQAPPNYAPTGAEVQ